jgi:hypothetical protein
VVLLFLGFVGVQAVSAAALFAMKLGLTPARIEQFYLGTAMARPRSLTGLFEVMVPHLIAVPLTLFIVIHLVAWAGIVGARAVRLLARVSFGVAAISVVAGLGVRYLWPALSVLKLAAFLGVEATLAVWGVLLLRAFWRADGVGDSSAAAASP